MTSKHIPTSAETSIQQTTSAFATDLSNSAPMTLDGLIDAQATFMQSWLRRQAEPLAIEGWQWLGAQPMSRYMSCEDIQHLINDWLLTYPISEVVRQDIRDILHTVIYHPVNDNVPLNELIDDTQIDTLATYISRHDEQRNALIHSFIGNEAFADLLTQTLYHAINDFMESTLDKAGSVGKLMKIGRSSFEKATNSNLDGKLQTYLHRNIKDLTRRAENNAQEHLSNEEVTRMIIAGWARIKDKPVSELQTYLSDEPGQSSIEHLESSMQQSYNRLRISPYLRSLIAASVETWYANHQDDTIATLAASLHIDEPAIVQASQALLPLTNDVIDSPWFGAHIRQMMQDFYEQDSIKKILANGLGSISDG